MNPNLLFDIGISIKKHRLSSGLSQEGLGALIECDKNTIGKIERGETDPRISTIAKIAIGLNLSLENLVKEIEIYDTIPISATEECNYLRLFQYCRQLSPEQFNNLCNTAYLYAKGNQTPKD